MWAKWYPSSIDCGSNRFRCVLGEVRAIKGEVVVVTVKVSSGRQDVTLPWRNVVRAGAIAPVQLGSAVGAQIVGCRVWVYWPSDDCCFAGQVAEWDGEQGRHVVAYDDSEVLCEELGGADRPYWYIVE